MPTITPTTKVAWMVWKTPVRQNVYAKTYKTKDPKGNPVRIMDSIVGPPTYTLGRELSDEEVKAFNPWNLLRATPNGVADDWDPAGVKDKYASVGSEVFRMELTGGRSAGDGRLGAVYESDGFADGEDAWAGVEDQRECVAGTGEERGDYLVLRRRHWFR